MSIITEEYSVNLTLGNSYPTRLRLVQNDNGRLFKFTLYNGATQYIPDPENTAVTFEGTCADGSGYTLDCTINSNGTVQVRPTKKVTGICGRGWARIVVTKQDQIIGSAEFDVVVERAGYDPTAPTPTPVEPEKDYTKIQSITLSEAANVIEISGLKNYTNVLLIATVPAGTAATGGYFGTTSKGFQLGNVSQVITTTSNYWIYELNKFTAFVRFSYTKSGAYYSGNTFNAAARNDGICLNQGKDLDKIYVASNSSSTNFPANTKIEVYAR